MYGLYLLYGFPPLKLRLFYFKVWRPARHSLIFLFVKVSSFMENWFYGIETLGFNFGPFCDSFATFPCVKMPINGIFQFKGGIKGIIISNIIRGNIIITCLDLFISLYLELLHVAISKCITSWFPLYRSVLCMSWLLGIHFWVYRSTV